MPGLRESFDRLIDLPPGQREVALADLAVEHPELANQLRALLPSGTTSGNADDPIAHRVLRSLEGGPPVQGRIGPYRLLRLLGAGGMGWVYLAERDADGVKQQVALKVVRGGGDSAADDPFLRERSVLASLQHPHIARFLDAGSDAGQRYLVMEYVEGRSLADWLEQRRPSLQQRLDFLIALAEAVDYAHANLIVHRDLKPANLLVRADDSPVLLDFGIAKLLDVDDPKRFTSTRVYTPTYAAPEQMAGRPVTVATDVFALGLILFELLSGEPARGELAQSPRTKPGHLARTSTLAWVQPDAHAINLELDRIVAMALREEPERRYRSAADLAADIRRWQRGLPVQAMPDSFSYRSRKWLRRHRWGALVTAAAIVATVVFVVQLDAARQRAQIAEAEAERKAKTAQAVADLMTDLFQGADPRVARNADLSARALLARGVDRLENHRTGDPAIDAQLRLTVGVLLAEIGDQAAGLAQYDAALAMSPPDPLQRAELLHERSRALERQNLYPESEQSARAALALREANLPAGHAKIAHSLQTLGVPIQKQGRGDEAEALFLRAEAIFAAQSPPDLEGLASARHNLAWVAQRRGDMALASQRFRQVVIDKTALYGTDDPRTLLSSYSLAQSLAGNGQGDEAIVWMERVVAGRRKANGNDSTETAIALSELAVLRRTSGDFAQALPLFEEALKIIRRAAPGSAEEARFINNLGLLHEMRGDLLMAEEHYGQVIRMRHALHGAEHVDSLRAEHNHCRVLAALARRAAAEACARDILQRRRAVLSATDPELDDSRLLVENLSPSPDRGWLLERFTHYDQQGPSQLARNARFAWQLAAGEGGTADDLDRLTHMAESLRQTQGAKSVTAALTELHVARVAMALRRHDLAKAALDRAEGVLESALLPQAPHRQTLKALRAAVAGEHTVLPTK